MAWSKAFFLSAYIPIYNINSLTLWWFSHINNRYWSRLSINRNQLSVEDEVEREVYRV